MGVRAFSLAWIALVSLLASLASAADAPAPSAAGRLVVVRLPITGILDIETQRTIDQALERLPKEGARPVLILEFRPDAGQQGEGTQLERAKSLARYLVSPKLSRVRTVAWLPKSVQGHAVLPVLACEEIIMHPDATLGDAGHDETAITPDMLSDYESIVAQRRTIPLAVVRGMLDKQLAVAKVVTIDKSIKYVLSDELEALKKSGAVSSIDDQFKPPGQVARYSGRDLREKYSFVSHLASDVRAVAAALKLPESAIEEDPSLAKQWKAVLVRIDGPIRGDKVNFIERTLQQRTSGGEINFVCLEIDSAGGSIDDSVRLAQAMIDLSKKEIRTVAFVPRQARGDAALIALACDQLVMANTAVLGGPGEANLHAIDPEDLLQTVKQIAGSHGRSWSLPLALVDSSREVSKYIRDNDQRVDYFSATELGEQPDKDLWKKASEDEKFTSPLSAHRADEMKLVRYLVDDAGGMRELERLYHLDNPPERLHANWAHLLVEQLARPEISGFLLFIAFFTLSIELMTPGVGLPGFISAVCFLLFFWANVLHGTAGTLEIVLFVGGVAFLAIELFALPGFGVFGIGGILMIISSVILASQTFVIPRNMYQLEQLPRGLLMVSAAGGGVIISLAVFRKYIHKAPLVNRMLLAPPEGAALGELSRRESLVSFDHLIHKRGTTLTPLTPAGKARFGDDYVDVVSDGDFIPIHASVYVIETAGNRVVVRAIEENV
jgi:membrane-bound ClpP family serine protease